MYEITLKKFYSMSINSFKLRLICAHFINYQDCTHYNNHKFFCKKKQNKTKTNETTKLENET